MTQTINIAYTVWDPYDSYGRIALELLNGFGALGYHVNAWGQDAPRQMIRPCWGGLALGYPTLEDTLPDLMHDGDMVQVTMFESTILPEGWVEILNRRSSVIVPARFWVKVFRENGVTVPIHAIPLGVSDAFRKGDIIRREKHPDKPMTFLTFADRGSRKGGTEAIWAFLNAFGDDTHYKLIVKCRAHHRLSRIGIHNPNIEILAEDLTDDEMADLYRRCDVMLFPSRGEGFGLPPREFAATGGIALATNWGGLIDDLSAWGHPITKYDIVSAWDEKPTWHGKLGNWAQVDVDALTKKLVNVVTDFETYAQRAVYSAEWVREHYTWQGFAGGVAQVWEGVIHGEFNDEPKNAIAE